MIKFIDVTGKTEDEAIQSALAQLKMDIGELVKLFQLVKVMLMNLLSLLMLMIIMEKLLLKSFMIF